MNVAIFGDSYANGETAGTMKLNHTGLVQYLLDDGHFAVNFSRQGNGQTKRVYENWRQDFQV